MSIECNITVNFSKGTGLARELCDENSATRMRIQSMSGPYFEFTFDRADPSRPWPQNVRGLVGALREQFRSGEKSRSREIARLLEG